jgi:ribosomal protein S25
MADIRVVSSYSLNSQYSMKRAGELARKFLEELKEE